MRPQTFPNFDYLRLFLASEVVFLHVWGRLTNWSELYLPVSPVPAFVAISGFLILGSWESSANGREFWSKRAFRILPEFLLALLLALALFGLPGFVGSLQSWASLGFIKGTNFPLWSLSCEEILYALLSVLMTLGMLRTAKGASMFWLVITGTYVWAVLQPWARELNRPILALAPSFATGIALYRDRGTLEALRPFMWLLVVATLLASASRFAGLDLLGMLLSPYLGAVAVLLIGTARTRLEPLPSDASYPLYTLHLPIITKFEAVGLGGGWLIIAAAISGGLAYVSGRFIGKPARIHRKQIIQALKKRLPQHKPREAAGDLVGG